MAFGDNLEQAQVVFPSGQILGQPRLVGVDPEDPRSRHAFIIDSLVTVFSEEPYGINLSNTAARGFSVPREPDDFTLDGAIAVGLHDFFVAHTVVVPTKNAFGYQFRGFNNFDVEIDIGRDALNQAYRLSDDVDRRLAQPDYVKRLGIIKRRQELAHVGVAATKETLLSRFRDNCGNKQKITRQQRALLRAISTYKYDMLMHLAKS